MQLSFICACQSRADSAKTFVMIPIYTTSKLISSETKLPYCELYTLWNGEKSQVAARFWLALDSNYLHLNAVMIGKLSFDESLNCGQFAEGLAENDDAFELFFGPKATNAYQEFHLSPAGAWWSATFSEPRKRANTCNPETPVETRATLKGNSCFLHGRFPRSILSFNPNTREEVANLRANVSMCLGKPHRYYSVCSFEGEHADFHQPDKFVPFCPLEVNFD